MLLKSLQQLDQSKKEYKVPILAWKDIKCWLMGILPHHCISDWTSTSSEWSKQTYGLYLEDDAMFPRFERGAIVIINPEIIPKHRCFVVTYIAATDNTVFRQILEENGDRILLLRPVNTPSLISQNHIPNQNQKKFNS
ncbi:MAG: S24 family peptidase [Gammaproteobacteria bacterium]|nr:S24 family peptidase [Gammaproteobacteria bacterium]